MVNELRDLLHDSVRVAPEEDYGLEDLLVSAKHRVRRRRVGAAAGVAACVAVAAAVPLALTGLDGGTGSAQAAAAPPVGRVLHLSDGEPATQGRDYQLLGTFETGDRMADDSARPEGLTPDGLLVTETGMTMEGRWPRWELRDPATGRTEPLPVLQEKGPPDQLLAADRDRLVFLGNDDGHQQLVVWVLDRASGEWQPPVRVDGRPAGLDFDTWRAAELGPGDRLWFAVTEREVETGNRDRLWSVPLDRPTALRDEGLVGAYDIAGSTLTFLEPAVDGETPRILHTRDLRTGTETTSDAATSAGCNVLGLSRAGDLVVATEYCGTHSGVRDDRVVVMRQDGEPVVTLQDHDVWAEVIDDRFVGLRTQREGFAGAFVYDLDQDRLLRLSDRPVHWSGAMHAEGDVVTWPTPAAGGGLTLHTGRFG